MDISIGLYYDTASQKGYEGDSVILSAHRRQKQSCGTHYIKKVSHRTMIIQVLCCFLLILLLFCQMALEACFHIFGVKRFDDTNTVVIDVDNLIPLAVKVVGG